MRKHPQTKGRLLQPSLFAATIVMLLIAVAISGCGASWGKLIKNNGVEEAFIQHRYLDGHNYYFLGFESYPEAILGLDTRYDLKTGFWKPMNQETHNLGKMVERMRYGDCYHKGFDPYTFDNRRDLAGFSVLDPNDKAIGVIYSCFDWFPVKFESDNLVSIYYPEVYSDQFGPMVEDRYDDR